MFIYFKVGLCSVGLFLASLDWGQGSCRLGNLVRKLSEFGIIFNKHQRCKVMPGFQGHSPPKKNWKNLKRKNKPWKKKLNQKNPNPPIKKKRKKAVFSTGLESRKVAFRMASKLFFFWVNFLIYILPKYHAF